MISSMISKRTASAMLGMHEHGLVQTCTPEESCPSESDPTKYIHIYIPLAWQVPMLSFC